MLVSGSNRCEWNFGNEIGEGKETLNPMGIVEEGEISDSGSVEEISEEDFKQESKVFKKPRAWTMQDLYKYRASLGYSSVSDFHNLGWARAVKSKPVEEVFVMDVDSDEGSKRNGSARIEVVIDDSGDEMDVQVVVDVELEEGEIDMDSDQSMVDNSEVGLGEEELVKTIREELESVTVVDAEKSFEAVCSQLQGSIERSLKLVSGSNGLAKESLVQLSFAAVQVLDTVFSTMERNLKEKNKNIYSRLLSFVNSIDPPIFSSEQIKELEVMMTSLESLDVLVGDGACDRDEVTQISDGLKNKVFDMANVGQTLGSSEKLPLDSVAVEPLACNIRSMLLEPPRLGMSNFRGRRLLVPLLDLHKDHDADSLPSPTREAPPSFSTHRTSTGNGIVNMDLNRSKVSNNPHNSIVHPYETDVVKAVSRYQQKFNPSSFDVFDRLHSPTPSEESDVAGGDVSGEVSSSSAVSCFRTGNPPNLGSQVISGNAAYVNSLSNPTKRLLAKSRDPRLRFPSSDMVSLDLNQRSLAVNTPKLDNFRRNLSSRTKKSAEESVVDGPPLKRRKNGSEGFGIQRDVKPSSVTSGWSDDTDSYGPQSINRNRPIENVRLDPRKIDKGPTFSSTGSSNCSMTIGTDNQILTLLKDATMNPTIILNILEMGREQRLAEEAQQKSSSPATSHPPSSKFAPKAMKNATSSNVSGFLQKPTEPLQDPSQIASVDESGNIHMRPRDPRRVLHSNIMQRNGSLASELLKPNGSPTSITRVAEDKVIAPKPVSLKEIPHISVSQASPNPSLPAIPQNLSAQPVDTELERFNSKPAVANSEECQNGAGSNPDVAVCSASQNSWGDVDLLFKGYDDSQKAAIQRERARRIEEQNKMFAARKLCLVLDLDHTLLNSAKFDEVDPVHEEILRKKEQQDRKKPHRHLFRFPHLGMWTKLRPGIWTFLKRASKLFELHLYTMGNKVYAKQMAKLLDPKGVLFAGRVIAKGDDGDSLDGDDRVPKTKDLEGVLGMESGVLIMDDSIRVWPHNKLNLIAVERYIYFPCSRRQFGLPGPSLLEIDHDERPENGTIASCLAVIERIHQNFFLNPALEEMDVRAILASEQRKILANCRIVFSRVIPVGEANPHLHPLWQTAEKFGASCTNQIDDQVTHVVANSIGTDKVNWALSTGRFVVHPSWVEASSLLYRRAREQDFTVKP